MSDYLKKKKSQQNHSDGERAISKPPRNLTIGIPNLLTVRQESTSQDSERHADEKEGRDAQVRAANRLNRITILGAFIAVVSLFLVYFGIRQSGSAYRSQQRAWVLLDSLETSSALIPNQSFPINVIVKNSGLSPALDVHGKAEPSTEGKACELLMEEASNRVSIPIAPQQLQHSSGTSVTPSADCIIAINLRTAQLTINGVITYKDIFRTGHVTHYCSHLNPQTGIFQACEYNNEAN